MIRSLIQKKDMFWLRLFLCSFAIGSVFFGIPEATAQSSPEEGFAKVVEDPEAGTVVLQVASRRFERPGQAGPVVTTYSMLHIADRSFFEKRQAQLDTHDVVLFERANPPGTGRRAYSLHKDDDAIWCVSTTKLRLQTLGRLAKAFENREKRNPLSIKDLQTLELGFAPLTDLAVDAWGNEFQFHVTTDALEIVSLGADKAPGGEGENADLLLSQQEVTPAVDFDKQLQRRSVIIRQTAELLGLAFQGDAMVHEKAHWRSSDLSIDQVRERLEAQGVSPEIAFGTDAWLPMQIMEPFLGLIQRIPNIKNTGKRLFIEMMAKITLTPIHTSNATGQVQVIIYDRNQVVLDDLQGIIEWEPNVKSVGIIYGGSHMPDLEARLRKLGYQQESLEWTDSITASLPKTVFEKAQWEWSRKAIRELMSESNFEAEQHMRRGQAASDPEQALAEYHKEQTLREELVQKNPENQDSSRWLALCYDRIAQAYLDRKQLDTALEFYRKGETVRRAIAQRDPKDARSQRDMAYSCGRLAYVLMETGQMEEAMGFCQQGHEIYQRLLEADPNEDPKSIAWHTHQLAECYDRIARSCIEKKQFDSALEYCQKSKTLTRSLAEREPKDAQSQRDLASGFSLQFYLLLQLGKTEEALECSRQGLEIVQRLAEADPNNTEDRESVEWYHALTARCYDRIAESHFENKQFDKAMEFYEKGATLRKSSVDRNPKDITSLRWLAWCFGRRGVVSMEVGNTKEAIDFFEQGLDIYQKLSDSDPSNTADRENLTWYTDQIKAAKTNP
ncbi:MAG: tetratricopeptide repeat protein [Planctomycetota bacterium]